jgi:hypothetical protein
LEVRHPRGLRREQGRSQEAPSCQERPVGHNLESAAARRERWAVSRRLAAARGEWWGTTVSRRLAAP